LLSRTTYGVRPQDVDEAMRLGPDAWLERQLRPHATPDPVLDARVAARTAETAAPLTVEVRVGQPVPAMGPPGAPAPAARDSIARTIVRLRTLSFTSPSVLIGAKLERAVYSERQLEEVMTDFWFNHFNVYFNKGQIRTVIADYESSAIRAHVFGHFEDLLVATAQHPAMLWYLDNFMSTAPASTPSTGGRTRPARQQRGLNENYARELLELHTLGVDGGYTQQDVVEVARAFTGWGVSNRQGSTARVALAAANPNIQFQFSEENHDRGAKVILGHLVAGGSGMAEGLEILGLLARHPSTARHIATKLVRHFVADDPPEALVDRVAQVFLETDGDLRSVTRTLFTAEEFYAPEHYRAKVKRPFEYVASALRATGADLKPTGQGLVTQLRSFRHLPYSEPAPTGFSATADEWVSAGAMLARMNFGLEMVAGRVVGISVDPEAVAGDAIASSLFLNIVLPAGQERSAGNDVEVYGSISSLLAKMQVGIPTDPLSSLIAEDLLRGRTEGQTGAAQGRAGRAPAAGNAVGVRSTNLNLSLLGRAIGLALGSPEFQRY
jgi:uncharacterized protein (DUF1800 family)